MNKATSRFFPRGVASIATPLVAFAIIVLASKAYTSFTAGLPAEAFIADQAQGLSDQTQKGILAAQEAVKKNPKDAKGIFRLCHLYMQGLRENADTDFYKRVESLLQYVDRIEPNNPETDFLRGSIAAGRHDFHEALRIGERLRTEHPDVQRYLGLLADAQIELGKYDEAIVSLQAMADLRPDYAALTRIAYVREITGDVRGAMEIMETALSDNTSSQENTAWGLAELGRLAFGTYREQAEIYYNEARKIYPGHAAATAGLAKLELFRGHEEKARELAQSVVDALPLPEYVALLGDIETMAGNADKAAVYYKLVQVGYDRIAAAGTNVELERAKFLAERGLDLKANQERAKAVYADRPTIYAADVLAWAAHKNGDRATALEYAEKALATGSQDAAILFHAGMIYKDAGKTTEAMQLFKQAAASNPDFSILEAPELKKALAE